MKQRFTYRRHRLQDRQDLDGLLVLNPFTHVPGSLDTAWWPARATIVRADDRGWVNQPVTVQVSSGPWQGSVPAIGTQGTPFTLNLSGWQVRVGVSFGL